MKKLFRNSIPDNPKIIATPEKFRCNRERDSVVGVCECHLSKPESGGLSTVFLIDSCSNNPFHGSSDSCEPFVSIENVAKTHEFLMIVATVALVSGSPVFFRKIFCKITFSQNKPP